MCVALLIYTLKFILQTEVYHLEHRLLSDIENDFILKFSQTTKISISLTPPFQGYANQII